MQERELARSRDILSSIKRNESTMIKKITRKNHELIEEAKLNDIAEKKRKSDFVKEKER